MRKIWEEEGTLSSIIGVKLYSTVPHAQGQHFCCHRSKMKQSPKNSHTLCFTSSPVCWGECQRDEVRAVCKPAEAAPGLSSKAALMGPLLLFVPSASEVKPPLPNPTPLSHSPSYPSAHTHTHMHSHKHTNTTSGIHRSSVVGAF